MQIVNKVGLIAQQGLAKYTRMYSCGRSPACSEELSHVVSTLGQVMLDNVSAQFSRSKNMWKLY